MMEERLILTWVTTRGESGCVVCWRNAKPELTCIATFPCRFLDITLTGKHNITSGKIYKEVNTHLYAVGLWCSCLAHGNCSFRSRLPKPNLTVQRTTQLPFQVISQERRGDYLGKTVQMVPHATDMVQRWIEEVASVTVDGTGAVPDVCLVEVSACTLVFVLELGSPTALLVFV